MYWFRILLRFFAVLFYLRYLRKKCFVLIALKTQKTTNAVWGLCVTNNPLDLWVFLTYFICQIYAESSGLCFSKSPFQFNHLQNREQQLCYVIGQSEGIKCSLSRALKTFNDSSHFIIYEKMLHFTRQCITMNMRLASNTTVSSC